MACVAGIRVCVSFTEMSAGDTEETGWENVSVRKTWLWFETGPDADCSSDGVCRLPVGLHST